MSSIGKFSAAVIAAFSLVALQPAWSAVTGMDFAGGCPEDDDTALCSGMGDSNADEANVAAILGVAEADVTQILTGFSNTGTGLLSGTWTITDTSITHLAFKSNGYFILGEVTALTGDWDNTITVPAGSGWDISFVGCPDTICVTGPRPYEIQDFQNMGGEFAALSNVRAFTVIPVPAAVWLFGSALGLLGWIRRRAI